MLLSLIGFIVLATSQDNALRYGFLHVCLMGAANMGPLVPAWLADNTPDMGTRSIIIGLNGYSNIGGVIAGQLYKESYAPSFQYPLKVTMILVVIGLCGFASGRVIYMVENRRRTRITAGWTPEQFEAERKNPARRGHQKLTFIYGY